MAWADLTGDFLTDRTTSDNYAAADINTVDNNSEILWENQKLLGGNGVSQPASDITDLNTRLTAIEGALGFDIKTTTADYTILDGDGYGFIHCNTDPDNYGKIKITLPTIADNDERVITIENSHNGYVEVDGEGAETINGMTSIFLMSRYNKIQMKCDATNSTWHIINLWTSLSTGMVSYSDQTVRHIGTVYINIDNVSGTIGEGETVTDGTTGATGVVIDTDGASYVIVKDVTSGGTFGDNNALSFAVSGATADVDGNTKNADSNLYHKFAVHPKNIRFQYWHSTDGTDANSFPISDFISESGFEYNWQILYVDTNSFKVQTGANGLEYCDDSGNHQSLTAADDYFNLYAEWKI